MRKESTELHAGTGRHPRSARRSIAAILLIALPGAASPSDFSILMLLLLIPFGISAALVLGLTWWGTVRMKHSLLKTTIRTCGVCLVLTPTHTHGGNGQMWSVALYDIVLSAFGGDPVYALQGLTNAVVAAALVLIVVIMRQRFRDRTSTRP